MPRKKQTYYDVKEAIGEGLNKDSLDIAYNIWRRDETESLRDLYNSQLEKTNFTEGSPEIEAYGDDENSENQAEMSSVKQEEETYDQNLEEKLDTGELEELVGRVKTINEIRKENDFPPIQKDIEMQEKSVKFDWEKYLEENPKFKGKDDKTGADVLLLQFFKDIAHKEGFRSVRYIPLGNADQGYCGVSCEMEWPNLPRLTSGLADAHFNNCKSFTKYYVSPMAENRSFIRAVKQYFNIPFLGKDEIGDTPDENSDFPNRDGAKKEDPTPFNTLKKAVKDKLKKNSFDEFKTFLRGQVKEDKSTAWLQPEEYQDWADYSDWNDVPKKKIMFLLGKIKNVG